MLSSRAVGSGHYPPALWKTAKVPNKPLYVKPGKKARAIVQLQSLFSMITVSHIDQVHIFFLAKLEKAEFAAGEESLEVALFKEEHIPWQELAFPTVSKTLKHYFTNPSAQQATHVFDIELAQALVKGS